MYEDPDIVAVQKILLLNAIRKPGEIDPVPAMSFDFHKMLGLFGAGPAEARVRSGLANI